MWKFKYDQNRIWFVCNHAVQKYICDPMTQHVNCEYELPGQANKHIHKNIFYSQSEHCRAGSSTICYAGMVPQYLVTV